MQLKNNLTVLSRVSKIAYNFTLVAVNPNNNQIQFDFLAFWLDNKSIEDVPAATIQFVLHFLQQSTASLRKDRSSCQNEISTIICLVHRSSPSVDFDDRIKLFRR